MSWSIRRNLSIYLRQEGSVCENWWVWGDNLRAQGEVLGKGYRLGGIGRGERDAIHTQRRSQAFLSQLVQAGIPVDAYWIFAIQVQIQTGGLRRLPLKLQCVHCVGNGYPIGGDIHHFGLGPSADLIYIWSAGVVQVLQPKYFTATCINSIIDVHRDVAGSGTLGIEQEGTHERSQWVGELVVDVRRLSYCLFRIIIAPIGYKPLAFSPDFTHLAAPIVQPKVEAAHEHQRRMRFRGWLNPRSGYPGGGPQHVVRPDTEVPHLSGNIRGEVGGGIRSEVGAACDDCEVTGG